MTLLAKTSMKIIPKSLKSILHRPSTSSKVHLESKPDFFGDKNISAPILKFSYQSRQQSDGLLDTDFGSEDKFYVKAMRAGELERDQKNDVVYLSPEQRANYELRPKDGLLFRKDGIIPVDTKLSYGNRSLLYVISEDKKIYSGRGAKYILHHSSFLAGGDVIAAGKLMTSNGKVIYISNNSGHYRPSAQYLLQAIRHFHDLGVLSPNAIVDFRHHGKLGLKEGIEVLKQVLSSGEWQDNTNTQA